MELTITDLNVNLSSDNLTRIKQKVRRMFSKVGDGIDTIKLSLNDINGPKGGKDKHCRIVIILKGLPDIVITDNQDSVMNAVNIALSRARLTLLKKVKRRQKNFVTIKPRHTVIQPDEYV